MDTTMAEATRKPLDDFIECPICAEVYKDPRTLPCLHTFCLVCCERLCLGKKSGDALKCPLCRELFVIPPSGVIGLRKNFTLEALKQINNPSICQKIIDLKKPISPVPSFCDKHTNRTLDWYCLECTDVACASCRTKFHTSHNVLDIEDVTEGLRATLTSDVKALSTLCKKRENNLNEIENEEKEFMKTIQTVETKISKEAERLHQLIERQKAELLAKVTARKHGRIKEVENFKQELRQQVAFASSLMSYTTILLNNGSVGDIAREATRLSKRASELLKAENDNTKFGSHRLGFASRNEHVALIGHLTESTPEIIATLIRSLPEQGHRRIVGLTTLDEQLYVMTASKKIEVYNIYTFDMQRQLSISDLGHVPDKPLSRGYLDPVGVTDLTSCRRNRCLYISNRFGKVVYRVEVKTKKTDDKFTKWNVDGEPTGLSVNADYHVIVTCFAVNKIKVFTTFGQLLAVIDLKDVAHPVLAIQPTPDTFFICHGSYSDQVYRVRQIDVNGNVKQSFGGDGKGPGDNQMREPESIAVINGFVFVADTGNRRVLMLSSTLQYIRTILSKMSGRPTRMCFDEQTGRLYLTEMMYDGCRLNAYSVTIKQPEDGRSILHSSVSFQ